MKKIEAIIRKTKFEDVKDALLEADIVVGKPFDVGFEQRTPGTYLPWRGV